MGLFGKSKAEKAAEADRRRFDAMNYESQQRERAKSDPVLAQRLIDEERRWRDY